MATRTITIAHSPDADDRFMFWPLKAGLVRDDSFAFTFIEADTQSLNRRALCEEFDITAVSAAHYLNIATAYQPLRMGASVGAGYGPVLVTMDPGLPDTGSPASGDELQDLIWNRGQSLLLTPGLQTTAHQALRALGYRFGAVEEVPIAPMDRIFQRLDALTQTAGHGQRVAALIIHEGRLVYGSYGARLLLDIGEAWQRRWSSNLPLGINVIRRSLPADTRQRLSQLLRDSCGYALAHRRAFAAAEAGRGVLDQGAIEHYLDLYANETTQDITAADRTAFDHLLGAVAGQMTAGTGAHPLPHADWV